jgi:hypothetical protein
MSLHSEHLIAENAPTPQQMRRLALVGLSSAKGRQTLRRREAAGDYYALDALESVVEIGSDGGELSSLRHTMGMRIGKRAVHGVDIWRLEYYNSQHLPRQQQRRSTSVSVRYEFEWNKEQTFVARRMVKLLRQNDTMVKSDIGDDVDRFYIRDDEASILGTEVDFEQVTYDDSEDLIQETTAYYSLVDSLKKQSV